jgi:alkylation response protein AidB-like acyl-CoA dehydrogenase
MLSRPSPVTVPESDLQWVEKVEALAKGFAQTAADYDASGEIATENLRALNSCGLDVACLPSRFGGQDLSYAAIGRILVAIAAADPSTAALWLMHIGAAHSLVCLSSGDRGTFYADELAAGKRFANALSEPTSGNMFLMPLQAAIEGPEGLMLDGAKRFVSGCEIADYYLVNILVDGTPSFFGVKRDSTVSFTPIWDTMGMRATRSQLVSFDKTILQRENLCSPPPPDYANIISVGLPFISIGIAESAVDALSRHANSRVIPTTGEPLSRMQWLKFDAAKVYVELRSARLLAEQATWLADEHDPEAMLVAVEAKLLANEVAKSAAALGVKVGGASGYLRTSPIQRHFRDAQAGALMAYSVEVCSDVVGGWVFDAAVQ